MNNNGKNLAVISLIINLVLVIAVIILFVNVSKSGGGSETVTAGEVDTMDVTKLHEKGEPSVVVFYHADSLNLKCNLMIDLQNELLTKQKDVEQQLARKQNELDSWNKKWQAKGMLMSHEQEQYMQEGQKLQNDAMMLQQKLESELYMEQERLTITGITRISNYCRDLALSSGYDYVASYTPGGQFMFCNPKMDITNELVKMINDDYGPSRADSTATIAPAGAAQ
jgi:Skp family chaperone for outer membrane proteins